MAIIRNAEVLENDGWQHVDDETALPEGKVIVSLARWQAEREALIERDGELGVRLHGGDPLEELAPDLKHLACVALEFPVFKDGRSYSLARLLRERYGFEGDIRATGDVLIDQVFFMHRCGINVLELREDQDVDDALAAFNRFTVLYQPAVDEALPLYRRR